MVRLFKRLAILAGLWLGVSVAGVVYFNTRSPEQVSADIEAAFAPAMATATALDSMLVGFAGPPPEPLPPDDVMLAETDTTLAEVETLYDELIATHEARQEAHTDRWEKRWAADAVTLARMAKEQALEAIERARNDVDHLSGSLAGDMTPEAISGRLDNARITAAWQKEYVLDELAAAREQLRTAKNAP